MSKTLRTAIAAAASNAVRQQLLHALPEAGIQLLDMPADGLSALEALRNLRPDLLVADAQLPGMEGAALVRRALALGQLPLRPAAILLFDGCYPLPERKHLEEAGACLLEKPAGGPRLAAAINSLQKAGTVFLPQDVDRADSLLDALGFPKHRGRECLRAAALFCAADERLLQGKCARLYLAVGRLLGLEPPQVERAMRHAINLAWQSEQIDIQNRIFADTLDAGRGQPTCGEMISRLADILRLEG